MGLQTEIGSRIKALRNNNKYSQDALSEVIGLSRASISQFEKGENYPSIETIVSIANFFNVSIDYIVLGKLTTNINNNDLLNTMTNQSNNQLKEKNTYASINASGGSVNIESAVSENQTNYQSNPNVSALLKEIEQLRAENQELKIINRYLESRK